MSALQLGPSRPQLTLPPAYTIKPRGYTSRPMGTHQAPWVHIKGRGYTSRPMGTHQAPCVHIKGRWYTSRAVGTHQGPWVHIKGCGYTSSPVGTVKNVTRVQKNWQIVQSFFAVKSCNFFCGNSCNVLEKKWDQ